MRDVAPVDQFGFVDLCKAHATSTITPPDVAKDAQFNGIEDPRSIGDRPNDAFELMQANKAIVDYKAPEKKKKTGATPPAPAVVEPPTPPTE